MTTKVYEAINKIQLAMASLGISKDRTNTQGAGFKFRGIDDVLNALCRIMAEAGLCIIPRVIDRECVERTSKNGGALFYTILKVEFDFISTEDGSKHTACTFGEAMDSGDKSTNKAMSAAYKYVALQTFCIPTEGDNDADASTHEVVSEENKSQELEWISAIQGCVTVEEVNQVKEKLIIFYGSKNAVPLKLKAACAAQIGAMKKEAA